VKLWTVCARGIALRNYKIVVVNVQTVLYLCAKFHNFTTSGSMGCHRLRHNSRRKRRTL